MADLESGLPETVGFIGLGRMGEPMVRRLAAAGVTVRAFDAAPRPGLADIVTLVDKASEVAAGASVVILMLPDSTVVEAVVHGGDTGTGLLDALAPGTVLVDMGSSEPLRTRALAEQTAARDVVLVDAPVSGGVTGAVGGTLTIMVGGPEATTAALDPLLGVLGRVRHVGPVGAGHALKALNNLMSATHLWVTSESMLVAERFGLDVKKVLDVVNGSSGRSGSTQNKWPNFILPETFDSGFSLKLMLKDMRIAAALAHELGMPFHLGDAAIERWADAAQELPDDADHTRIAEWLRSASEVPAR